MSDKEKVYLGIWGYSADAPQVQAHDSGAAVIVDGQIVSAVNEERLSRKKSDGSYPFQSIEKVLELAGTCLRRTPRGTRGRRLLHISLARVDRDHPRWDR